MARLDFPDTCPKIDKAIVAASSAVEDQFEALRELNSAMRQAAEDQLDALETEYEDKLYELEKEILSLEVLVDSLTDELSTLKGA